MTITLAGGASTNSRAHRPLPAGAVSARTLGGCGVHELVEFGYPGGYYEKCNLLSWVIGQSGLLWGNGPFPFELDDLPHYIVHGSYGHAAEFALADALGVALDGVFSTGELACRFYQDGGTSLAAAARLARHATERTLVASYGYHGAAEEWAHQPNSAGIPPDALAHHARFEWGDYATVRDLAKYAAAICVEVPPVPDAEARLFLSDVRQACSAGGAVFILDEVVTGFRLALSGAAGYYGVRPDIACYGKAMSATGCVSAIVGRADLVEPIGGEVFYSTTFGGSPGPCGVAAATVRWLTENAAEVYGGPSDRGQRRPDGNYLEWHDPYMDGHLRRIGRQLQDGFNALGLNCVGQPERSVLKFFTDAEWLAFCSAMIGRGVMVHRPQFPTLAHTEADVASTLEAAAEVIGKQAAA